MLLNGVHLLPDLSGALIWPKERLVAVSDPLTGSDAPAQVPLALRRLKAVLSQRRPRTVVWLGGTLPAALAAGRLPARDAAEIARLCESHDWVWVAPGDPPADLPGRSVSELAAGALTFRHQGRPDAAPGEVSAAPWPRATSAEASGPLTRPAYVFDGRRLILPAFGPRPGGTDVLAPAFQALFRRPFQVMLLDGGRLLTRPRGRLISEAPAPCPTSPSAPQRPPGARIRLFGPGN